MKKIVVLLQSGYSRIKIIIGVAVLLVIITLLSTVVFLRQTKNDETFIGMPSDDVAVTVQAVHAACQDLLNGKYPDGYIDIDSELTLNMMKRDINQMLAVIDKKVQVSLDEACLIHIITINSTARKGENDVFDRQMYEIATEKYMAQYNADSKNMRSAIEAIAPLLEQESQNAVYASLISDIAAVPKKIRECMIVDGYIVESMDGEKLCRNNVEIGAWPKISDRGAQWGGCEMKIVRAESGIQSVTFCAKLPDGTIYKCTEVGCAALSE